MHTGSNLGGHGLGDSGMTITTSLAHARSQSAVELQQAVAEANSLAAQAAEAQNRAQQAAQVCSHSPCICHHVFLSMRCPRAHRHSRHRLLEHCTPCIVRQYCALHAT